MRWAAFVRNVMVGREGLKREVLVSLARSAGGTDVQSHLATGNLTITANLVDIDSLTDRLEEGVQRVLGRHEMVAVRSLNWLAELMTTDPFRDLNPAEWEFEVGFLRHDTRLIDRTCIRDTGRTILVAVHDREAITARPKHGGQRPHVNRLLERATGNPVTARGWSTLQRIIAADTRLT